MSELSLAHKRNEMLQRLAHNQEQRARVHAAPKDSRREETSTQQSEGSSFLEAFRELSERAQSVLVRALEAGERDSETELAVILQDMERLCSRGAHVLVPRDLESMQKSLAGLQKNCQKAMGNKGSARVGKRFGFQKTSRGPFDSREAVISRPDALPVESEVMEPSSSQSPATSTGGVTLNMILGEESGAKAEVPMVVGQNARLTDSSREVIEFKKGGIFTLKPMRGDLLKEILLLSLENCSVTIQGPLASLVCKGLEQCQVMVGPVAGPVHITAVTDSSIAVACHQLRVHDCKGLHLRCRVGSKPILEGCSNVSVSPYNVPYDGVEEDLKSSDLATDNCLWKQPQDLSWLRQTPSPHWQLVED